MPTTMRIGVGYRYGRREAGFERQEKKQRMAHQTPKDAAGRYTHHLDRHPAPLDPNFSGAGRCLTDDEGRYRFVTVKPGAYPWKNHDNAWRPAHIHLSLFGPAFRSRLITQMYFPGDPLFAQDPIFQSVRDPEAQKRMISTFDLETTEPEWALGYKFDVVLEGRGAILTEQG